MSDIKLEIPRGCYFVDIEDEENIKAVPSVGCNKLNSYDWLGDIDTQSKSDIFEVRFKNTRKGYYQNVNDLVLNVDDIVAVEAAPGHDIGIISSVGEMVTKQMRKTGFRSNGFEFKKIYRKAKSGDIAKWQKAISTEHKTMILARQIASSLELNMKIGDVEYQGDGAKAIFYYIADERVDFRELIKLFAEQFKIRIEMKQIGARQEAGRIGGIGSCGRELCCSKWVSSFVSVTTSSARFQEISLNPQKLAGQCSKLKCCLNYEVDAYIDYKKRLPRIYQPLETLDANYHLVKTDILRGLLTFSSDQNSMVNVITIDTERVKEIIRLNKRGVKPEKLQRESEVVDVKSEPSFTNVVGEESITRFDSTKQRPNPKGGRPQNRNRRVNGDNSETQNDQRPDKGQRPEKDARNDRGSNNERTQRTERNQRGQRPERPSNVGVQDAAIAPQSETSEQRPMPQRNSRRNFKPRNTEGENGGVGESVSDSATVVSQNSDANSGANRRRYNGKRRFNNGGNSGGNK